MTRQHPRPMSPNPLTALAVTLIVSWLCLPPAWAGAPGCLKLMVTTCNDSPLDGALVDVEVHRSGSGVIASDSDYTDDGYVQFLFSDLEDGDLASVTVTAPGLNERVHTYVWMSGYSEAPGLWDIEDTALDGCEDVWWDQGKNIIQCRCD